GSGVGAGRWGRDRAAERGTVPPEAPSEGPVLVIGRIGGSGHRGRPRGGTPTGPDGRRGVSRTVGCVSLRDMARSARPAAHSFPSGSGTAGAAAPTGSGSPPRP